MAVFSCFKNPLQSGTTVYHDTQTHPLRRRCSSSGWGNAAAVGAGHIRAEETRSFSLAPGCSTSHSSLPMRPLQQLLLVLLVLLLLLGLVPKRRPEGAVLLPESHATNGHHQKKKNDHTILHASHCAKHTEFTSRAQSRPKLPSNPGNPGAECSSSVPTFSQGVPHFLCGYIKRCSPFFAPGVGLTRWARIIPNSLPISRKSLPRHGQPWPRWDRLFLPDGEIRAAPLVPPNTVVFAAATAVFCLPRSAAPLLLQCTWYVKT